MSHQGWIKLHRKIKDHWIYDEKRSFSRFEAWLDLIMRANHKDRKVLLGSELILVERGQFITSVRKLCDEWSWSNTKVNTFLKLLEQDEMIIYKSDTKKTVITIVNYSTYHDKDITETSRKHHENDTETSRKHTNKNVKNVKNDKKNTSRSKLKFETHHFQLAELLFKEIQKNNQNAKKPNLENWANTFRLMMDVDNRKGKEIQDVILFCQEHDFWYKNILSADKLRKQFDRLALEKGSKKEKNAKVARF